LFAFIGITRVARENYDWSSVAKIFMRAIDGLEAHPG